MRSIYYLVPMTRNELLTWYTYDPETGKFFNVRAWGKKPAGREAKGSLNASGYVQLALSGRPYVAHRLAWLYAYGAWPDGDIDHINRDKTDNRISNLRLVSRSENQLNRKRNRNNKSGYNGVYARDGGYTATIKLNGVRHSLGVYDTFAEARAARRGAEIVLGVPQRPA